ncbi:MAG: type II toxin-antitoxin system PemK/MazF family toxin [Nitriliruptorales bacterium]
MIRPGEIYMADLDDSTPHPVLVVSREELNRGRTVMAALVTSARFARRSTLPNCVPFQSGQFGLTKNCVAQCENMLTLDIAQLDVANGPLGQLDDITMRDVIRAVGYVMEADCEPM